MPSPSASLSASAGQSSTSPQIPSPSASLSASAGQSSISPHMPSPSASLSASSGQSSATSHKPSKSALAQGDISKVPGSVTPRDAPPSPTTSKSDNTTVAPSTSGVNSNVIKVPLPAASDSPVIENATTF